MLRRLSVALPSSFLRKPTPQLVASFRSLSGSSSRIPQSSVTHRINLNPSLDTHQQQRQQQMISPPPSPSSSRPPTPSSAQLISPSRVEDPPPDLTDAQLRRATVDLYADPHPYSAEELKRPETHGGPFAVARSRLDYAYHRKPTLERRRLQDQIVSQVLAESHKEECRFCHAADDDSPSAVNDSNDEPRPCGSSRPDRQPVALFTSGGMGAGKGHVLRTFLEDGRIRLEDNFVWIDPDKISQILPERPLYLAANPNETATLLHGESSLLQEILTDAARADRRSVVIDGSLSCSDWFRQVMHDFRSAGYLVEVLFVFCTDEDIMWSRAERRRLKTGRRVSRAQIRKSRLQSPASVAQLSSPSTSTNHQAASIDRLRLVDNSSDDPGSQPRIVYDSRNDSSWQDGVGGEVDVVRIALGDEAAQAKARM